jgi:hypothetical protein
MNEEPQGSWLSGAGDWFGVRLLNRPSGAALAVMIAFVVGATAAATLPIGDVDVWWVAAAGRRALAEGRAPTANMFSITEPDHPWVMHEWLLAVPYAAGLGRFGPGFFALVALASMTATASVVLRATLGSCRNLAGGAALGVLGIALFGKRLTTARPSSLALFFPVAMAALAFGPRFSARRAALAVLLSLAWANTHGSFPLGVALLGAAALAQKEDRGARALTCAAAALVTFVNPYGAELHALVFGYFRGDDGGAYDFIQSNIMDFQPLWKDRGKVAGGPELVGLTLFAGLVAGAAMDRAHRIRALFCAGMLGLAVLHVRHVEQFGFVTVILLAPYFDEMLSRRRFGALRPSGERRPWVLAALAPGLVVALVSHAVVSRGRGFSNWVSPYLGGPAYVRLAEALPDGARVFTPFKTTGLLIWLGAERGVRVLFDARNDCYSRGVMEAALALWRGKLSGEAGRAKLNEMGVTHLLLVKDEAPYAWVERDPALRAVERAGDWALFVSGPRGE